MEGQQEQEITFQVDFCHEGRSLEEAVASFISGIGSLPPLDVTWTVIQLEGPAGGWPVIGFSGNPAAVEAAAWRYTAMSDETGDQLRHDVGYLLGEGEQL